MRWLFFLIAVCWTSLATPLTVEAYEILILQSSRAPAYEETLRGFRSLHRMTERVLVMSDYNELDLKRIVREERPLIIIALGDNAYSAASKIRQLPVVVAMAPNFKGATHGHPSLAGIELHLPPERYLAVLSTMKVKRVGILANHVKSGNYIRRLQQAASSMGIEPVVREVSSAKEVAGRLNSLRGAVDALWLLPDETAVARETTDAYFLFSIDQQVPVISFSSAYLGLGAAVTVEADRYEIGRQAAELATGILTTGTLPEQPVTSPKKFNIRTNPAVLRRLQLPQEFSMRTEGSR